MSPSPGHDLNQFITLQASGRIAGHEFSSSTIILSDVGALTPHDHPKQDTVTLPVLRVYGDCSCDSFRDQTTHCLLWTRLWKRVAAGSDVDSKSLTMKHAPMMDPLGEKIPSPESRGQQAVRLGFLR